MNTDFKHARGSIEPRYKTKAAERLYHSTDCPPTPPCVLTPDFTWPRCLPSAPPSTGVGAYKRTSAARCVVHATLACAWGTLSLSSFNDVSCRPPLTLLRSFLPPFCAFVKCNMQLKAIYYRSSHSFLFEKEKRAQPITTHTCECKCMQAQTEMSQK